MLNKYFKFNNVLVFIEKLHEGKKLNEITEFLPFIGELGSPYHLVIPFYNNEIGHIDSEYIVLKQGKEIESVISIIKSIGLDKEISKQLTHLICHTSNMKFLYDDEKKLIVEYIRRLRELLAFYQDEINSSSCDLFYLALKHNIERNNNIKEVSDKDITDYLKESDTNINVVLYYCKQFKTCEILAKIDFAKQFLTDSQFILTTPSLTPYKVFYYDVWKEPIPNEEFVEKGTVNGVYRKGVAYKWTNELFNNVWDNPLNVVRNERNCFIVE